MIYGDDEFAIKCLLLLYDEQEADEQATQITQHENSVGFNKSDSVFLSQCAEQAKEGKLSGDEETVTEVCESVVLSPTSR